MRDKLVKRVAFWANKLRVASALTIRADFNNLLEAASLGEENLTAENFNGEGFYKKDVLQ